MYEIYFIIVCLKMFSGVISLRHARETCFEKSEVLNGFINDISKSRNEVFFPRKSGKGGGDNVFYQGGHLNERKVETFKGEVDTMKDTMTL